MALTNNILTDSVENVSISIRIIWPAVIFAASRKLSVRGRTLTLINSISLRNGFSHNGALSGSIWAIVFFIECIMLLIINNIHIGMLNDRVNIMWLLTLNEYGAIPITLM